MRILIVDDSDLLVERLLERVAKSAGGVEVVGRARNAGEAYTAIRQLQPDVVILDLCMPGGSGIGVLKDIRSQLGSTVIVLTAYQEPQYRKECLEMGAKFFLDKATQLGDIPEVLRSLLANAPAPNGAGDGAAEPEPAGLRDPPNGDLCGSEPPAGEGTKTIPKPELLVSRSSKGALIYYTCSLCLRGFVLSDAQLPKEAVRETSQAFREHVRQKHPRPVWKRAAKTVPTLPPHERKPNAG